MSEVNTGERASSAIRRDSGISASLGAGDWLSLAATPTFAAMALLTAASGGSDMLCMAEKRHRESRYADLFKPCRTL